MWPFLQVQVERHVRCAKTWLDLCCGAGTLLRLVCRHGYEATGVDLSKHQLAHARRNAPKATLHHSDICDLDLRGRFDVITSIFDSLNYILSARDLLRAFRRARRHLAPGGIFIFDVNTYEGLEDHWNQTTRMSVPGKVLVLESHFDSETALASLAIVGFVKQGRLFRKFEELHIERGYRAAELDDMLDRAGFTFRKRDGIILGRPRKRSPRLIYVCRARTQAGTENRQRRTNTYGHKKAQKNKGAQK